MQTLTRLLREADPLRVETPFFESHRDRIRANADRARRAESPMPVRARRSVVSALAATVGIAAAAMLVWSLWAPPVLAAVRFEVRLAEELPAPGLIVAQSSEPDQLIYLHPEIVVSNEDVAQSRVVDDGAGAFGVEVEFLAAAADRMRQATAAHVGRRVAILVDGRVVNAPVVRSAIGTSATISGNYTRTEAQRIADGLLAILRNN